MFRQTSKESLDSVFINDFIQKWDEQIKAFRDKASQAAKDIIRVNTGISKVLFGDTSNKRRQLNETPGQATNLSEEAILALLSNQSTDTGLVIVEVLMWPLMYSPFVIDFAAAVTNSIFFLCHPVKIFSSANS